MSIRKSGMGIEVEGLKDVRKGLGDGIKDIVSPGIREFTLKFVAYAKMATVVDTGRLRSSITQQISPMSAIVGSNVQYAEFVEYGTEKMEARHMEGSMKVLGEGMFDYALRSQDALIAELSVRVVKGIKKAIKDGKWNY
tara:strand:+ start:520 stop:936 length:417 start_codon:yes stop_codon:yes gene_type:complete